MNRAFLYFASLILVLSSCNSTEIERLQADKRDLIERNLERDQEINDFVDELNNISDNIREIAQREDLLLGMTIDDMELAKSSDEQILDDLFLIDNLIIENKERVESLEKKVRKGTGKIQDFERLVANLKMDLVDKENSMVILKAEMEQLEGDYADLLGDYFDQALIARIQERELNRAFFTYGTKKELEEMEVVEKKGGVLGLGVTHRLKDDFNKDYFTEVDIRDLERIPIESKEIEFVSTHPEGTFEIVKEEDQIKEIVITDKDAFWSGSRYLAMVVK